MTGTEEARAISTALGPVVVRFPLTALESAHTLSFAGQWWSQGKSRDERDGICGFGAMVISSGTMIHAECLLAAATFGGQEIQSAAGLEIAVCTDGVDILGGEKFGRYLAVAH